MFGHLPLRHPQQYNPTAMTHTFNKKRFWLIVALLAVAEVLIIGLVLQWKYIFPSNEVSDLYKKYAEVDGVDATYIKGYKVNDSVFVDVTMLHAKDIDNWCEIADDLNVPPPPELPDEYKDLFKQSKAFSFFIVNEKKDNSEQPDNAKKDICIFSREEMTICIFHLLDKKQIDEVLYKKLEELPR